ncbi:chromate resistance protein ChrB domain-containing protein [Massilia cavernae]|uniref:ChrB C-terminal domain-containing protein n=1 Tax=Massilia cavernae TaxID=2320864 RepID=A0A418XXV4_9BURK|nr:chromate resistance protein ChrB domain-containing protein [Massilia cavernae]RJG17751.1 hypothetical protein D3872_10240 [Massilia cavernae]
MSKSNTSWILLIATLPASSTASRMRLWRAVKSLGCATLRDGVYLLPFQTELDYRLKKLSDEVRQDGGNSWVLRVAADPRPGESGFGAMFDRTGVYDDLCRSLDGAAVEMKGQAPADIARNLRKMRKELESIRAIDYFPSEASALAEAAWLRYVQSAEAAMSIGEPAAVAGEIPLLPRDEYRGRRWATRKRIWVDRVASAWLIQRFIDPEAEFLWLDSPLDCPADALGFDFDGATFTHVGECVTFEVLLASFGLSQDPALARLGALVRNLDAGGGYVPEAVGFEALMHGARKRGLTDDQLLANVGAVLDSLHAHFATNDEKEGQ